MKAQPSCGVQMPTIPSSVPCRGSDEWTETVVQFIADKHPASHLVSGDGHWNFLKFQYSLVTMSL